MSRDIKKSYKQGVRSMDGSPSARDQPKPKLVLEALVFDNGYPDLTIAKAGQSGNKFKITVKSKGSKPVPVHLTVTYKNGKPERLNCDILVWKDSDRITLSFKPKADVQKITFGNVHDTDIDKSDNPWEAE